MNHLIAAAFAAVLLAGTAEAQKPGKTDTMVYIAVNADDWASCQAEGGCDLYSKASLRELVQQVAALSIQRAKLQCGRGT